MNTILELWKPSTFQVLWNGLVLTATISTISVILSVIFGMILAVLRNGKNKILKWLATIYIEFVRNVPNLLWIFTVFLVFQLKSKPAGITAFTIFTTAAMAEIIRGGLNAIGPDQTEAGLSQGFTPFQVTMYIVMPQALRKMLPAIISQIVTVIKDTSFLYSVIALQELFGSSQILMGRYFEAEQVFALYIVVALIYFVINFAISSFSRHLAKSWAGSSIE
ncbi:amino acid ABC transporter permease [Streptococcus sp. X16XC17]|uniref:amino acid ABC transporter permease n=1 Tax=unclassified Streptococcus TaxID=2608887 RepID=UPI00066FBBD7|nr:MULTISPECIES: amino acid ABC transporter permease [unclassified Streptococcus]TCD46102.1 amino acid ABC transporter permease [Streptococcus sp. X16XC17]